MRSLVPLSVPVEVVATPVDFFKFSSAIRTDAAEPALSFLKVSHSFFAWSSCGDVSVMFFHSIAVSPVGIYFVSETSFNAFSTFFPLSSVVKSTIPAIGCSLKDTLFSSTVGPVRFGVRKPFVKQLSEASLSGVSLASP